MKTILDILKDATGENIVYISEEKASLFYIELNDNIMFVESLETISNLSELLLESDDLIELIKNTTDLAEAVKLFNGEFDSIKEFHIKADVISENGVLELVSKKKAS